MKVQLLILLISISSMVLASKIELTNYGGTFKASHIGSNFKTIFEWSLRPDPYYQTLNAVTVLCAQAEEDYSIQVGTPMIEYQVKFITTLDGENGYEMKHSFSQALVSSSSPLIVQKPVSDYDKYSKGTIHEEGLLYPNQMYMLAREAEEFYYFPKTGAHASCFMKFDVDEDEVTDLSKETEIGEHWKKYDFIVSPIDQAKNDVLQISK